MIVHLKNARKAKAGRGATLYPDVCWAECADGEDGVEEVKECIVSDMKIFLSVLLLAVTLHLSAHGALPPGVSRAMVCPK